MTQNNDKKSWIEYIFVAIVSIGIILFLYMLFSQELEENKIIDINKEKDSTTIKRLDSHEFRLNHIDSLHLRIIKEK